MKTAITASILLAFGGVAVAEPVQQAELKVEEEKVQTIQAQEDVVAMAPETPEKPEKPEKAKELITDAEKTDKAEELVTKVESAQEQVPTPEKEKAEMDQQEQTVAIESGGAVVITKFDKDKDGKLTIKEAMSDPVLLASFGKLDVDGDGQLTETEISAAKEFGEQSK